MPLPLEPGFYAKKHDYNVKKAALLRSVLALANKANRAKWRENNILTLFRLQMKAMRKCLNLTQQQMADAMQITRGRYCIIESGDCDISLDTVRRIALVFDCAVEVRLLPFREVISNLEEVKSIPPYMAERSGCEFELQQTDMEIQLGQEEIIQQSGLSDEIGLDKMLTEEQKRRLLTESLRTRSYGGR